MQSSAKPWRDALRDAAVSGSCMSAATAAAAAACGVVENRNALQPINAVSHVLWGKQAAYVPNADFRHTLLGLLINEGASVFWATLYEARFGRAAERGDWSTALAGAGAIAGLAYVVDYHVVPKRLTPGWEERLSGRSLAIVYVAMALSLPIRGLLRRFR